MVKIGHPTTPNTTPTTGPDDTAPAAPTTQTQPPNAPADSVSQDRARESARTQETLPESADASSDKGISLVADLAGSPLFGEPNTRPSRGPDLEVPDIDPSHLAADLPGMLNAERGQLPPDSVQAQALARLEQDLGGLHFLAPQFYGQAPAGTSGA